MIDKDEDKIIDEEQWTPKPNPTKSKIRTSFLKSPVKPINFNTSSTVKAEQKNHIENPNKQKLNKTQKFKENNKKADRISTWKFENVSKELQVNSDFLRETMQDGAPFSAYRCHKVQPEIKLNEDQAKVRENLTTEWNLLSANDKKLFLDQTPMKNTN